MFKKLRTLWKIIQAWNMRNQLGNFNGPGKARGWSELRERQ